MPVNSLPVMFRLALSRPISSDDMFRMLFELGEVGATVTKAAVDHVDVTANDERSLVDAREIAATYTDRFELILFDSGPDGHRVCRMFMFDVSRTVETDENATTATVSTYVFVACECRRRFRRLADLAAHHQMERGAAAHCQMERSR